MDAESTEPILEFDRMHCHACGYERISDEHQIKDEWNELVRPEDVRSETGHLVPSVRFDELWQKLGARGQARDTHLLLRTAYDEPHRAYHTARHIGACLRLLDDPSVQTLANVLHEVEAAIWFHDAVYDPRARDNEEASARLVERCLGDAGVASDVVARIAAYVRATKEHVAEPLDGQLVIDIDLFILGESPAEFARFERDIRREYAWVDDAAYVAGRTAVLRRFADRPSLYRMPLFRERYEAKARANIDVALRALSDARSTGRP
jgi:predicted metal-dependent HD superfamily phosphohydrolase